MKTLVLCAVVSLGLLQPGFAQRGGRIPPAQQANIQKLQSDLSAIKANSQVTPAMKQQLATDLTAMAQGATKPSPAAVQQLVNDLTAALSAPSITKVDVAKLTQDFYQVMNSAGISQAEADAVSADIQVIVKASGVTQAQAQTIAADVKAILAQVK